MIKISIEKSESKLKEKHKQNREKIRADQFEPGGWAYAQVLGDCGKAQWDCAFTLRFKLVSLFKTRFDTFKIVSLSRTAP